MNKLIKFLCLSTLPVVLLACSKADISGVWIPEKVSSSDTFYSYYEITSLDSNRYSLSEFKYKIRNPIADIMPMDLPKLIDKEEGKKLEFTKDNTYCVEGSLNTECFVFTDRKLDVYKGSRLVKSKTNPPLIPVNK